MFQLDRFAKNEFRYSLGPEFSRFVLFQRDSKKETDFTPKRTFFLRLCFNAILVFEIISARSSEHHRQPRSFTHFGQTIINNSCASYYRTYIRPVRRRNRRGRGVWTVGWSWAAIGTFYVHSFRDDRYRVERFAHYMQC